MPTGQAGDAFVMAYLQSPPPNNSMQSSFPHSDDDDANPASQPSSQSAALQLQHAVASDVSLTAPEQAAMEDNAEEHSVHVQCWGAGLSGEVL